MAPKKPAAWGCGHPHPIEVVPLGEGRRARCLRCGECGPVRPGSKGAPRALKDSAGHRGKIGAPLDELRAVRLPRTRANKICISGPMGHLPLSLMC
jgi:hypothetical protein